MDAYHLSLISNQMEKLHSDQSDVDLWFSFFIFEINDFIFAIRTTFFTHLIFLFFLDLLNILFQVQQYLLPQCQKCWKMQGNAVRFNRAVLVHHHNLRLYHFAPAIAYYLSENKAVRQWIDRVSSDIKKQRSRISNRRPLMTIS